MKRKPLARGNVWIKGEQMLLFLSLLKSFYISVSLSCNMRSLLCAL
jgi:hypothetical protein